MTPDEFDKLRARSLTALHALYSAIHSTQDGEVPEDLGAYAERLLGAMVDAGDVLHGLAHACQSARAKQILGVGSAEGGE